VVNIEKGVGDRGGSILPGGGLTGSVVCVMGDLMRAHARQAQVDHEILFAQNGGIVLNTKKRGVLC
jgi:hypothetical protein